MRIYKSLLLAFVLALTGCASGSSILVGEARESIAPEKVRLYIEPPESYDTIALVNASSDAGLTEQDSIDYAVEELKKQAAKLGANGVLLGTTGSNNSVMLGGQGTDYQYLIPISEQTVSGQAIYVEKQ
ncbi:MULTISPECIES: hypothetical protein [Vibrio harveyi group]|uniref:Lipoprotein n=3 Tax=Vibrio harveyi group TaxID=717610 RepID=A0A7Y0S179_VIBPH|nr:hypothetical protein [Vibrio parahaemolyticus]AYO07843.1 hypothetical protein D0871_26450 [Vibrio parahaemolyticus]EGQ8535867.1 hypothetical protein [Vibrio parahaemolyticus]EHC7290887.1 hypothetical protein [Vibrio parahaemolyticus]EJA7342157.1 hypothetical protein [Vibrio parahaemolyticus]EJB8409487.1 hypothetical protein [Vibrio parahaemolyticus]